MKVSKLCVVLVAMLIAIGSQAQKKKEVLFTVDKIPVYSDEFLRVFEKNRAIVDQENRRSISEYLDLYVNYKLKLNEAYKLGLDTVVSYKNELAKYREQLIQPYLSDKKVTDSLVKEAYNRMLKEINASHILVRLSPTASAQDTLKAYKKIMEARSKVLSGMAFEEVAKAYSEDPSAVKNGGNLGYFTAFGMVYPFENAAYTSRINEVSMPFKTSFGYHIVMVNDIREARGEVEVAHIMIKNNRQDSTFAKSQIDAIYTKALQGDSFDFLAQQYSDDKSSAPKGGRLPKFAANKMIPSFSEVAFDLKEENEISKPFRTPYGWHIVRLLKKYPVKSFDEQRKALFKRIESSPRASVAGESIANRLRKTYTIKQNKSLVEAFIKKDLESLEAQKDQTLVTINGRQITVKNLLVYSSKQRGKSYQKIYDDLLNQEIISYYKDHLEQTNEEFSIVMKEYKDGLLLFDLLQQKVWKRAEKDTLALRRFFNERRSNYMHGQRGDLVIATCTDIEKAKLVKTYLEQNKSVATIKDLVNDKATIHVLFSSGLVAANSVRLPKSYVLSKGVSNIFKEGEREYVIVMVKELLAPRQKKLNETRGLVINDFQEHIEKKWVESLKNEYAVKINKRALKRLEQAYSE